MNKKLRSFNSPTFLAYALIAPAAIYILLIVAWPVLETIRLSFTNSSLAGEDYVGFENYEKMLSSKKFNKIVTRTFVWMFFSVSLKLIIGLIGAILLNANLRGRSMFRVLIMPPWVVPIAIGMLGWLWLYNGYFGIIAGVGMHTGILDGPFGFLAYKQSAFISTIVADVWVGTPMVTVFFLAAMQGVPRDYMKPLIVMELPDGTDFLKLHFLKLPLLLLLCLYYQRFGLSILLKLFGY